jgi:hypothetical protein
MKKISLILAAAAVAVVSASAFAAAVPAMPKGYEKWEKSKQKIVTDKSSLFYGIHYIYVDKKALPAYKAGKGYPEGSRFVVEFFSIKDEAGKPVQGKKSMVVLMKRDKSLKQTGGWLFAGYGPDGKPSGIDPVKNCFDCHVKEAKEREFVISKWADFK